MRIINESLYDTRVLRRIVVAAYRAIAGTEGTRPWWRTLGVAFFHAGARGLKDGDEFIVKNTPAFWIRLPRPRGDEWIWLTRQAHGVEPPADIDQRRDRPPLREEVVVPIVAELQSLYGVSVHGWSSRIRWNDIPRFVPLKAPRAPKAPRDVRAERYARVLELERIWTRKAKLARTKLRALRRRRLYYERSGGTNDEAKG